MYLVFLEFLKDAIIMKTFKNMFLKATYNFWYFGSFLSKKPKSFSSFTTKVTGDEHRSNLMARGLPKKKQIPGVKNVLLVCSGKGGVGKSTIAVNLAAALKLSYPNKNVGILDSDVFGPSVPLMMNLHEAPSLNKDRKMVPLINHGVKCISMGFLVAKDSPIIWRGLMVMQALNKLMWEVFWDDTDYLIVDTPPGTGDTLLSLLQNITITGVILITTPQVASIEITNKGASMFQKLNVPIIGIVENMSFIKCTSCSQNIKLFGTNTEKLSERLKVDILTSLPLSNSINDSVESGTPVVLHHRTSESSVLFLNLAKKIVEKIKTIN